MRTYFDPDGICHWCRKPAVADYFGLGLCDQHYSQEVTEDMRALGFPQ